MLDLCLRSESRASCITMSNKTLRGSNAAPTGAVVLLALAAAATTGCATRKAPFNQLDQSTVTILRLQQAPQSVPTPAGGTPLIPGLPAELQGLAQQTLLQLQQQGIIPPGLIPGLGTPATPAQRLLNTCNTSK